MAQALLQLLALCLDLIFRFVPANGFANEEVLDENEGKDCHEGPLKVEYLMQTLQIKIIPSQLFYGHSIS